MSFRNLGAAFLCLGLAAPLWAQPADPADAGRGTNTPLIDRHEAHQQDRIEQGAKSGELTKHEARRVRSQQKAVDAAQKRARADGTVSAAERRRIRAKQERANQEIYEQKHDDDKRPAK